MRGRYLATVIVSRRRIGLVAAWVLVSACGSEPTGIPTDDIPDCAPCGKALLRLSAAPLSTAPGTVFHIEVKPLDPTIGASMSYTLAEPGDVVLTGGVRWSRPTPESGEVRAWVVVNWHDGPSNDQLVARDSVALTFDVRRSESVGDTARMELSRPAPSGP